MNIVEGDILKLLPSGGVLFHQVNTLGKFGAGLARQIKKKWPEIAKDYTDYCKTKDELYLAGTYLKSDVQTDTYLAYTARRCVIHLFAQKTIGKTGRHTIYTLLAIALAAAAPAYRNRPCYFPYKMGCGLGGGDWNIVQTLIGENFPNATIVRLK